MSLRKASVSDFGFIKSGFHFTISYTSKSFRNYIDFHEENFNRASQELQNTWENLMAAIEANPDEYSDEYRDHLEGNEIDKNIELRDDFTNRIRESIIIQLYSFLEQQLHSITNQIAIRVATEEIHKSILDSTRGSVLKKYNKFFKLYTKVDLEQDIDLWNFIDSFRELRNIIVHKGGRLRIDDPSVKKVVVFSIGHFELKPYISGTTKCSILLDDINFLYLCVKKVDEFLYSAVEF